MSETDRRTFMKAPGAAAAGTALPASIQRALSISAHNATGTIMDIEHVIILMQENRAFDHYFGSLQGVRGFNDPRAVTLSTGKPVWYQPTGTGSAYVLPFHPTSPLPGTTGEPHMGITFIEDLEGEFHRPADGRRCRLKPAAETLTGGEGGPSGPPFSCERPAPRRHRAVRIVPRTGRSGLRRLSGQSRSPGAGCRVPGAGCRVPGAAHCLTDAMVRPGSLAVYAPAGQCVRRSKAVSGARGHLSRGLAVVRLPDGFCLACRRP